MIFRYIIKNKSQEVFECISVHIGQVFPCESSKITRQCVNYRDNWLLKGSL